MPKYKVTIEGKSYAVTVPEGQGPQQAYAYARQAQAKQSPGKAAVRRLGDDLVNMAAGYAQGPFSLVDMAAQGLGKLSSLPTRGMAYAADKLGASSVADVLNKGADALSDPFTMGGAIEKIAPTPKDFRGKALRFAAQATTAGVPLGRLSALTNPNIALQEAGLIPKGVPKNFVAPKRAGKTIPAAAEVVKNAEKEGVRVLTSDVRPPRTFVAKSTQTIGERIPYAGTGPVRQAQQAERIEAVRTLARDYGAAVGDDISAPAVDDVMKNLSATRGKELKQFTGMKQSVIDNVPGAVPVQRTVQAIDQEIASLQGLKSREFEPIIAKLNDWKQAIQGQDLKNIEALRKQVGESFKAPELAAVRTTGEGALTRIYSPLRNDMGDFIKSNAGPEAFSKWRVANARLAGMANDLNNGTLRSVLRTGQGTPEDVSKLLFSQKPSDVRRLYAGLSKEGRVRAQAAILQRAVEKSGGMDAISPDRFSGQVKALGDQIGIFFQGDDLARVNGLSRVLQVTQRASVAGVNPPTGVQNAVPVLAAVLTDAMGGAGAGLTAGGSAGLLARAYESAAVRNALIALGKSKPGSPGERVLMDRAAKAIAAAMANTTRSTAPITALNDNAANIMRSAASSPAGGNNGEEQQPYQ